MMEDKFSITLVRSRIKSRPYCKTDGQYLGATWNNDIGLQTVPNSPKDMFHLCSALLKAKDTCVVMGTAIKPEIIDTDRTLKNFKEEPVSYLVLDLDKYEVDNISDLSYEQIIKELDKFILTASGIAGSLIRDYFETLLEIKFPYKEFTYKQD